MSFGITKTIPATDGVAAINALYDGTLNEYEFHMAGTPSKLKVGDYVYTIFNDQLIGRLKIKELIGRAPWSWWPRPANGWPPRLPNKATAARAIMTAPTGRLRDHVLRVA